MKTNHFKNLGLIGFICLLGVAIPAVATSTSHKDLTTQNEITTIHKLPTEAGSRSSAPETFLWEETTQQVQTLNELYEVTFNVDMSQAENFDPEMDNIYLTGSMLGWAEPGTQPENQLMERLGSSMIWSKTLLLEAGEYQYKYFLNYGWFNGEWGGEPNRIVFITVNTVFDDTWGVIDHINVYSVTFNVDMGMMGGFNPETDVVYITGSMLGWAMPGTHPDDQIMSRVDNSMIWTKTLDVPHGVLQYKYFLNEGWQGGEWVDERSRWVMVTEDTAFNDVWAGCEEIGAPHFEGFEDAISWQMPDCWQQTGIGDYGSMVVEDFAASGDKSLRIMHNPYSYMLIASPFIAQDLDALQIKFKAVKGYNQWLSAKLQLGTVSHPNDLDSFNLLQEFSVTNQPDQAWHQFSHYLDEYDGTDKYFAFKLSSLDENDWSEVFIDDIEIELLPNCLPPRNLMAADITFTEALLSWTQPGICDTWDLIYGLEGFDPVTEGTLIENLAEPQYLLQGLDHSRNYQFYVHTYCGVEVSEWSLPAIFSTLCQGKEFNFAEPHENAVYNLAESNLIPIVFDFIGCGGFYNNLTLYDEDGNWLGFINGFDITSSGTYYSDFDAPMAMCGGVYYIQISYFDEETISYVELNSPYFTIINEAVAVEIINPWWGSNHYTGDLLEITWNASNDNPVDIAYSLDNGNNWIDIASGILSTCQYSPWGYNTFSWLIPLHINGTYTESKIRVSMTSDPTAFSLSHPFNITSVRPLEISSPEAGTIIQKGEDIVIDFEVFNPGIITFNIIYSDWTPIFSSNFEVGVYSLTFNTAELTPAYGFIIAGNHSDLGYTTFSGYFAVLDIIPDCPPVTEINILDITASGSLVNWIAYGNATAFQVSWGEYGFDPDNGNLVGEISQSAYEFAGLQPGSYYELYVRSDCGNGLYSLWTGPVSFVTEVSQLQGDANCDGMVNILDVVTVINHILEFYTDPFCYDNADANGNSEIDILDVVAVINLILNTGKSEIYSAPAHIYLKEDAIKLESDGTLTALQFELHGDQSFELQLSPLLEGYMLADNAVGNKLTGVIFHPQNKPLPAGMIDLIGLKAGTNHVWGEVFAGNINAQRVAVNQHSMDSEKYQLEVFPNPSQNHFSIKMVLPEKAFITLVLYDMAGREVYRPIENNLEIGIHEVSIGAASLFYPGVYVLHMQAKPAGQGGQLVNKQIKAVILR